MMRMMRMQERQDALPAIPVEGKNVPLTLTIRPRLGGVERQMKTTASSSRPK
jgi:hypothetical protein